MTRRRRSALRFGLALGLGLGGPCSARQALAQTQPPRIAVGARAGIQSLYLEGDGDPSDLDGYFAGIDGTLRLTRHLALGLALEASVFDRRSDRLEPGPAATSTAAVAELRIDTNPEGPWSAHIELGPGYRWLQLPLASGPIDGYQGVEPLRLRVGPAYHVGALEVSAALGAGFGWFLVRPGARNCAVTGSCVDSLYESDTGSTAHVVADFSVALRGWP